MKIQIPLVLISLLGAGVVGVKSLIQKPQPVYFPQPTGQYAVGTKTFHIIDQKRKETLANDPAHPHRELMLQIWYPATGTLEARLNNGYSAFYQSVWQEPRPIYSYAQQNGALAEGASFPVVIYSHGLGGNYFLGTSHGEDLASHGYVVVGISHTYFGFSEFPDRKTEPLYLEKHKGLNNEQINMLYENEFIELWVADVQCVLDYLFAMLNNKDSVFYHRLDLNAMGMMGHSFGGTIAIQLCIREPRIICGVDMDGRLYGKGLDEKTHKSCLFMLSSAFAANSERAIEERMRTEQCTREAAQKQAENFTLSFDHFIDLNVNDVYKIILNDAGHMVFTDFPLFKRATFLSSMICFFKTGRTSCDYLGVGQIEGKRAIEIINSYLVHFFDAYLRGASKKWLQAGPQYSDVDFYYKSAQQQQ